MIQIREGSLKTHIAKFFLFDLILSVERPYMIIVMMIASKEKFEIEVTYLLNMKSKQLFHSSSSISF